MGAPGRHVPGASGVLGSPARNRLLEPLHLRYSFVQVVCVFDGGGEPWSERGWPQEPSRWRGQPWIEAAMSPDLTHRGTDDAVPSLGVGWWIRR